jgi:hypothetical protein
MRGLLQEPHARLSRSMTMVLLARSNSCQLRTTMGAESVVSRVSRRTGKVVCKCAHGAGFWRLRSVLFCGLVMIWWRRVADADSRRVGTTRHRWLPCGKDVDLTQSPHPHSPSCCGRLFLHAAQYNRAWVSMTSSVLSVHTQV